ncbi:MAG: hypothetical protein EOP04_09025, partial [Proteobacteria bacterium]
MSEGCDANYSESSLSDAITFLESQHREIEHLFELLDALDREDRASKFQSFQQVAKLILNHSSIEERYFFPLISSSSDPGVIEDDEIHYVIKRLIANIETGGAIHPSFHANVTILKEIVLRHFSREETSTFA